MGIITDIQYSQFSHRIQYAIGMGVIRIGIGIDQQYRWYTSIPYSKNQHFMIVLTDFMSMKKWQS